MKTQNIEVWRGSIDEILHKVNEHHNSVVGFPMPKHGNELSSWAGIEKQLLTIKTNCETTGTKLMVGSFFYLKPTLKNAEYMSDQYSIPEINMDLTNQFVIIEDHLETESLK